MLLSDLSALPEVAARLLQEIDERLAGAEDRVVAFYAPMGAGKTTLISEICRQLGVAADTSSPTFAIVNEYSDADGNDIYHFDCYRLGSPQEAEDMGVEEYLYSGNLCLIEWPEQIEPFLPEETLRVSITPRADGSRIIRLNEGGGSES